MTVTSYYDSAITLLSGTINGSNKTFTTPVKYVANSIRLIVNGQVYESTDDNYGWTETDDETIEMTVAPLTGDVVQAFYKDKDSVHADATVKGSPFHPSGVYT